MTGWFFFSPTFAKRLITNAFPNSTDSRREQRTTPSAWAPPVIFNCSGLGARALFGDEKLIPARGQLEVLMPQPEIDYAYIGAGHMFPRSDGIILGGTFDPEDWSLAVNPEHSTRILNTHTEMMKGVK